MSMNKAQKGGKVSFLGYIPPLASAITFGDDAARVKIDIPPEFSEQAKQLVDMQRHELRITVEVIDGGQC